MPTLTTDHGVKLYYEDSGAGTPIVFVHEFARMLSEHSAQGSANTMLGYQGRRPSLYALVDDLARDPRSPVASAYGPGGKP
jgi:hypothetical protein